MAQILNNTYEVLELIGKGGMSTVFKARHVRLKTEVAVKSVRKDQAVDLLAEVSILTKLNHPNLVRVIDIFEDEKLMYIVMDYIEGEDLQHVIKREKVIPEETVTEWFRTLGELLHYLHTRKPPIIYRDMKPANVILQKDGTLKLIDFGIAREYKATATGDTTYIGTNGFAAPEQFGLAQSDGRTDIYSLGMTMFYLATGKSPYEPPYGHVPARQINPSVSEKLERILDKCTKDNPEDRYQSADELLYDLNDGQTVQFQTGTGAFTGAFKPKETDTAPWSSEHGTGTSGITAPGSSAPPKKTPAALYAGIGAAALAVIAGIFLITSGSKKPADTVPNGEPAAETVTDNSSQAAQPEAETAAAPETEDSPSGGSEQAAPQGQADDKGPEEEPADVQKDTDDTEKEGDTEEAVKISGTIRVGTSCSYAPFSLIDIEGKCNGMEPYYLTEVGKRQGIQFELVVTGSFDELAAALESGQIDVIMDGLTETEERDEIYDFSEPYYQEGVVVIAEKGHNIRADINNLSGLRVASDPDDPFISAFISKYNMNPVADLEIPERVSRSYEMIGGEVQAYVIRYSSVLNNSSVYSDYENLYLLSQDLEKYGFIVRDDPGLRFAVKKGNTDLVKYLDNMIDKANYEDYYLQYEGIQAGVEEWLMLDNW